MCCNDSSSSNLVHYINVLIKENDNRFMFTSLRYLKSGDEIKVSDDKNVYVYKVNFVKKVNKNDTSLLNESTNDKLITLYTCYDVNHFYPQYRIVARGTLDRTIER